VQIRRMALPALIPAAFLLGTTVNTGIARQAQADPAVVQVAFMKVDPDKDAEYLALERDIWKPMHQDRIKQGTMRSWTVYSVRFPAGTTREYDYAVVNTYNSLADIDRSMLDVAAKIHPKMPAAELGRRTGAARSLVRGELWYKVDEAK
jgi:L-rhamnose mutarotase